MNTLQQRLSVQPSRLEGFPSRRTVTSTALVATMTNDLTPKCVAGQRGWRNSNDAAVSLHDHLGQAGRTRGVEHPKGMIDTLIRSLHE